jgi:hypothetical protein
MKNLRRVLSLALIAMMALTTVACEYGKPAETLPSLSALQSALNTAEGEAKPAEGEAKPAEGEAKPAEGEAKPAEGQ